MLFIQSILFFVLGAAAISFFMLLLAPFIWRRALYLARQAIRMEIPLSLNEVEADYDFARAAHAIEICRHEEQVAHAQKQAMTARLALDMAQAEICYLAPFEKEAEALQQTIIQMRDKEQQLSRDNKAKGLKLKEMADQAQKHQQVKAKIKTQNAIIKMLKRQVSTLKRQLARLEQQAENFQNAKQLKHQSEQDHEVEFIALRHQIKQIAARIVADIALSQDETSPLLALIEEAGGRDDLAGAIHQAMAKSSPTVVK